MNLPIAGSDVALPRSRIRSPTRDPTASATRPSDHEPVVDTSGTATAPEALPVPQSPTPIPPEISHEVQADIDELAGV